jgi:uncharacterized membrane protein YphA (DoxX/SURF4 family)
MKILDNSIRIFVGALFIFSGLVKLNDPMGTEIKMQEYFEVFATDFGHFFELFIPLALPIALFIIILEVVVGIAILINHDMKWTLGISAVLIVFFTFLTFYSAYFNKVTDCGCFGDAIPLTPWESFFKDVILTVFIAYLIIRIKSFKAYFSEKQSFITLTSTTILSMVIGFYAIRHLPFIDFRPYAVGDNIPANMIAPETPNFVYTFEKDGEHIESGSYLSADDGYTYVGHKITNEEMTIPKITDYNIWNEEIGDYTQQSFVGLKLFIIVYESGKADVSAMPEIATLISELGAEVETIALTASAGDDFRAFLADYNIEIPFFYGDATVLKAMIRSSPGVMLLNDGTVIGKWHFNDVPTSTAVKALF